MEDTLLTQRLCGCRQASTFFSKCVRFKVIAPFADVNALFLLTVPIPHCRTHKTFPWQEVEHRCASLLAERISDRKGILFSGPLHSKCVENRPWTYRAAVGRPQFQEAQARLSVRLFFSKRLKTSYVRCTEREVSPQHASGTFLRIVHIERITERNDQNSSIDAATATTPCTVRGSAKQLCGKRTCENIKVCLPEML